MERDGASVDLLSVARVTPPQRLQRGSSHHRHGAGSHRLLLLAHDSHPPKDSLLLFCNKKADEDAVCHLAGGRGTGRGREEESCDPKLVRHQGQVSV
eukprot:749004-Hanusia_phi.AAC.5